MLLGLFGLWRSAPASNSLGLCALLIAFFLYQAAGAAVAQGAIGQRIQNITVADIMDREPVTIPATLNLLDAQEQFFLRYRWPWFAVVDPARHFLGVVRGQRVDAEISAGRPALAVSDVLEQDLPVRIGEETPLESLLAPKDSAAWARWSPSTRTECCRASSRSRRCAGHCSLPHLAGPGATVPS